jgi:transcriptional regulator with XRE-family HTH domain
MDDRGYTWFGEVLYEILRSRGSSQSAFAREARSVGYDYRQNSVSNWMRGVHAAPRELPTLLEQLYALSGEERVELALAFAYGQFLPKVDLEDVRECREHYRRLLEEES